MLRDGHWTEEEAAILVPGDIISIKLGDIIPADARLLDGDPLKIDQVLNVLTFSHLESLTYYLILLCFFISHFCLLLFVVCVNWRIIASHQRSW